MQDTGLAGLLPTGEGFITFNTLSEALAGVEKIVGSYESHCRAALELAEAHFCSDRVLTKLLAALGIA